MSNRDKYWDDAGCARELAELLEADVGIPVAESERVLFRACSEERDLPDPDEAEHLVMGAEDGEVGEELTRRFPRIHAALSGLI